MARHRRRIGNARRLRATPAAPAKPEVRDLIELRGGWWQLPDGRKVQGRAAAIAALNEGS